MTRLAGIPATELRAWWPAVEPFIDDAMKRGRRYRADDIFDSLAKRQMQLWAAELDGAVKAVAVTDIVDYPLARCARVFACTGEDRNRWLGHLATIEAWAREAGCVRIESWARPGWERILKDWKKTHVLLEKDL